MTTYHDNKGYTTYDSVRPHSIGRKDDLQSVVDKCRELADQYGLSLSDFEIEGYDDYGSASWRVSFSRPATVEEIREFENDQSRYKESRRKAYENLKKEFGQDV